LADAQANVLRPRPRTAGRSQPITAETGLKALTWRDFAFATIGYYVKRTGIPVNFGITVALGFIVGAAVVGQTFYIFVLENLRQFGSLKAMGVANSRSCAWCCCRPWSLPV
jgi:putative ABC transport system permease protein